MSHTAVVLHGGGGPATVAPLSSHLRATHEVFSPVHPGWNGTPAVAGDSIPALAGRYLQQLSEMYADRALVVGSSVGGWIAAEMAIQDAAHDEADRVVGQVILIDSVGADVPGAPLRDVFSLSPRELAEYAWADPDLGFFDPSTLPAEQVVIMQGNMAALAAYAGGDHSSDPTLLARLAGIIAPALVVWGDADRMVTTDYGSALAAAIPDSRFVVIEKAGHLPHLEKSKETFDAIDAFVAQSMRASES